MEPHATRASGVEEASRHAHDRRPADVLVIAVSVHAIFDVNSDLEPLQKGSAFSFIKALQTVSDSLVGQHPGEELLLDVILLATDSEEIRTRIVSSSRHYGFQIGRLCFCSSGNLIGSLQSNNVKLFLSTDTDDVRRAQETGIPAAVLYRRAEQQTSEPLKVLFSGDVLSLSVDRLIEAGFHPAQLQTFRAAQATIRETALVIGQMRRKFGKEASPISVGLITVWGTTESCGSALKRMREWGVDVDEAYCLARAPYSPILDCFQPHIIFYDGLCDFSA
ncbi:cytosolic 5'-nucleotidase 1A isoform X1 [Denticeps clupeoides]|uniref:Uncharacterized protein n=1 Tax=Denticeps clupeoides TaxID=299321 RepID=A0AAY4D149_9TELE|nr:cytosolic 5'-nucleotidase 1A-like isoform X1 [Denticeps clupeoides]